MTMLALEFSSEQRSVAVLQGAEVTPAERRCPLPRQLGNSRAGGGTESEGSQAAVGASTLRGAPQPIAWRLVLSEVIEVTHANTMKPFGMIEAALRQAGAEREQIECLAIGLGPGSYGGIRAAIALAQGWQLACDVKLLGVSSAEAIALEAETAGLRGRVNVVIDAQRDEFYLATWELDGCRSKEVLPLRLASLGEVRERADASEAIVGPEVTKWFPAGRLLFPRAATVGRLAVGRTDFIVGERLEPIYLREVTFVKAPPPRVI